MKRFLLPACLVLLGTAAARCSLAGDVFPLPCALLLTLALSDELPYLFAGCLLGAGTTGETPYGALIAALPVILLLPWLLYFRKKKTVTLYPAALAAAYLLPAIFVPGPLYDRLCFLFGGAMAVGLKKLTDRLYRSWRERKQRRSLEKPDALALSVLGTFLLTSLPKAAVLGFDLRVIALLASSALALLAAGEAGSRWACACGLMWVVKGGDDAIALALMSGGLLAGLLVRRRGGILLGFAAGDLLITLCLLKAPVLSLGAGNLLLGCAFEAFLPEKARERIGTLGGRCTGLSGRELQYVERLRRQQAEKLEDAARLFSELSRVFVRTGQNETVRASLLEKATDVCRKCEKSAYCLQKRGGDTAAELDKAVQDTMDRLSGRGLPLTLAARCVQPTALTQTLEEEHRRLLGAQAEQPGSEGETALQLKSLAGLLSAMAREMETLPEFDEEEEKRVFDVLASRVPGVTEVVCRKTEAGDELEISLKKHTRTAGEDILRALETGEIGKYRCERGGTNRFGGYTGTFLPCPRFAVQAYAARKKREGEKVSGDSYTYGAAGRDGFVAAISDGAGSGERAAKESAGALEMLEAFAGGVLERGERFRTMNRLLLSKGGTEDYSTMDVTEFDLGTGILYWTKIGAVPGYLVRGGRAEKIGGGALPMGIVTGIAPATVKKLIREGDVIVLLSDGVYDALCTGYEDGIADFLEREAAAEPSSVAEGLLKMAGETKCADDMTVLALRVCAA